MSRFLGELSAFSRLLPPDAVRPNVPFSAPGAVCLILPAAPNGDSNLYAVITDGFG
ncbi:MAG: hypothetical protein ACRD40_07800 [Candidatus Acidiferrales bacterium]